MNKKHIKELVIHSYKKEKLDDFLDLYEFILVINFIVYT